VSRAVAVGAYRKVSVTLDLGTQVEVDDGVKQGDLVIISLPSTLSRAARYVARRRAPPTKNLGRHFPDDLPAGSMSAFGAISHSNAMAPVWTAA